MEFLNQGTIFTNDNCIGCNRCVIECPCPGANVSVFADGRNRVKVNYNKCIECGRCIEVCTHNARSYRDDTEAFFDDLKKGISISVIISPTFFITYGAKAPAIISYLKSLGVKNIYEETIGSDIMTWAYVKYLETHDSDGIISQPCSCVVNYIERFHPALISRLVPVQSSFMCTAIYAKDYLGDESSFAYLSPCIARRTEMRDCERDGYVSYNVTFNRLESYLRDVLVDAEAKEGTASVSDLDGSELSSISAGILNSCPDGFSSNLKNVFGDNKLIRPVDGTDRIYRYLSSYEKRAENKQTIPYIADVMSCSQGCMFGTGTNHSFVNEDELYFSIHNITKLISNHDKTAAVAPCSNAKEALLERFKDLKPESFSRAFYCKQATERNVPEVAINAIFSSMHKLTEESRHIDCHTCGYHSCHDMARAIALGYANKNNCVHYVQDENLRLFYTDVFTEIPNINAFVGFCKAQLKKNRGIGYSAIRFNIRNFSLINKNYGLQVGDDALKEFSSKINSFANEDEIMARISEDNFIGMVKNEHLGEITNLLNNVTLHIKYHGHTVEYPVSVHLGIYTLEGADAVAGDIIRKMATTISVLRRRHDSHVIYYNETIESDIHKEMSIERMLPEALEDGEFVVYYQPKVSIKDKQLVGAEALVRWRRGGELVSPSDFIPISEEIGFVRKIDFFVLEQVCRMQREWIDRGIEPVKISVNFSKKHFVSEDVAERISAVVDKYKVPPKFLEIEFTETAYIDGYDNLSRTLSKLKTHGITSSIDDFGTGYSSLSLLQDLDFTALKLDKSLLGAKCYDEKNRTVIAGVIRMAKELNMQIIAEGVETIEEYQLLEQLSCDIIQGYIFDKPLPVEEFESRLIEKTYHIENEL